MIYLLITTGGDNHELHNTIDQRYYGAEVISVPIFDYERKPVAAVGLFTSSERMTPLLESNALDKLKQTAADISENLLFSESE